MGNQLTERSLHDKSVLITGASSGIGAALAHELAHRGARVALLARRENLLGELAEEIRSKGGRVAWAAGNVDDEASLHPALDRLAAELGGIDIVVSNAGHGKPEPPDEFRPGHAMSVYNTNLLGMLRTFDWALPGMLERRRGYLVGICSVAAFFGFADNPGYCGSKAAMRIHLQSLRLSVKAYGIDVTTICPGYVRTPLVEQNEFELPFIWEADRAARKIADIMEKRRREVIFPWQMTGLVVLLSRLLPTPLAERMMSATFTSTPEKNA